MKWGIRGLIAAVVVGLTSWAWIGLANARRESNERNATAALKTLASGEADFRGNDRDGNRIQDFWVGDVAGLYYLVAPVDGQPIRLLEKDVADADAKPLRKGAPPPIPRSGYLFRVLEGDASAEDKTYAKDTQGTPNHGPYYNHSKFAFCAYPADYPRSGRWTYVINEGNTIFKVDTQGQPVLRWPPPGYCGKCERKEHPGSSCPFYYSPGGD